MLKFFRKIRQHLIDQGDAKRYLLYAIGEILLVMIGILLALQVNNWNNQQLALEQEQASLKSLKEDFTSNLKELNTSLEILPVDLDRLHFSTQFFGSQTDNLTKAIKDTIINSPHIITDLVDGSLIALLNSNKIELIQNDSLKQLLTRFPAYLRKFKKQEDIYIQVIIEIHRPILEKYLSLSDLPDYILRIMKVPNIQQLRSKSNASDFVGLLNDITYQNTILNRIFNTDVHLSNTLELKKQVVDILQLIEKEIHK